MVRVWLCGLALVVAGSTPFHGVFAEERATPNDERKSICEMVDELDRVERRELRLIVESYLNNKDQEVVKDDPATMAVRAETVKTKSEAPIITNQGEY